MCAWGCVLCYLLRRCLILGNEAGKVWSDDWPKSPIVTALPPLSVELVESAVKHPEMFPAYALTHAQSCAEDDSP